MKKITMLAFLAICTVGFGQNRGQGSSKETDIRLAVYSQTDAPSKTHFNNSYPTISENVGDVSTNPNGINTLIPFTKTNYSNTELSSVLFHNGPHWNVAGDPKLSLLESLALGMNTIGSQAKIVDGTSIADDIVFTADVEVTSIDLFAYQTGATAPSVTAVYLQVWDGHPAGNQSNIIWGDLTTNIMEDVIFAGAKRVTETEMEDSTRLIQRVSALTEDLTLTAGTYWIQYSFEGSNPSGPWVPPVVILGESTTGDAIQNQTIEGENMWVPILDSGTNTAQGLPFIVYGEVTSGETFPEPYCEVPYFIAEPITLVEVANISNRSGEVVDGSPAHENFTAIVGNMTEDESYVVTLEGNTNGDHTNSFTVFIDWDQDGVFNNEEERYQIGTIHGSTGIDGNQVTDTITVPAGVEHGLTRMRVMKTLGADYAVDACTGFFGQAEDYTIDVQATSVNAPFPYPYCAVDYTLDIEPITLVEVAGISNATSAGINGSPAHEDFTDIVGEMVEGESYTIALEGNTGGYTNSFTVFIDWNQDGILDNEEERYEIDTMYDSNGADGQQAVGIIEVPIGALAGPTRMRVIKRFTSSGSDFAESSCLPGSNYGQAEDYTINVTPSLSIADNTLEGFSYYPNPTSGGISLKSDNNIDAVVIYNLLGQKVIETRINATTSTISLADLTVGTYIMYVTVEGKIGTYKVLKN